VITETCSHSDAWLMLPWLANGRLSGAERVRVEEHVRSCGQCTREVALQRRLCEVLTEPERITYAPGPSFRKLMDRIDGRKPGVPAEPRTSPHPTLAARKSSAWRPPGLAWAASFVLAVGLIGLTATTYRWSQPRYITHTVTHTAAPSLAGGGMLHVAFRTSLPLSEVGDALRSAGARVVEGPDDTGIVGVAPVVAATTAGEGTAELRSLAARLRADTRVRWVEPVVGVTPGDAPQHGPPSP
jgi:Putative zinc-finger